MADLADLVSSPPSGATVDGAAAPSRAVRRRRTLPGGRAVVGAFLVMAASVGVFAAYLDATAAPSTSWLVAARAIAPGSVVTADALDTAAMDVPDGQRAALVPADALDRVVGRVALGPVRPGDLLLWTTVLAVEAPVGATTFTFAVPTNRVAFRGDLAAGDRIDLVATYADTTQFVARGIPLLASPAATASEGSATITVAIDDPGTVLRIANALDAAKVFVVRSAPSTEPGASDPGPPPYRATSGRSDVETADRTSGEG